MATGTTIAEKLANIAASKAAILASLTNKGITVPDGAMLEDLSSFIDDIELGADPADYAIAFEGTRTSMISLTVPEGITKIGAYAFYNCTNLQTLTLPSTLTSIESNAFRNCNSLESIGVPSSVSTVGDQAFYGCSSAKSIFLGRNIRTIGFSAFGNCTSLENLTLIGASLNYHQTAFSGVPSTCYFDFLFMKEQLTSASGYPWGIPTGAVIHCTNGDLTVGSEVWQQEVPTRALSSPARGSPHTPHGVQGETPTGFAQHLTGLHECQ